MLLHHVLRLLNPAVEAGGGLRQLRRLPLSASVGQTVGAVLRKVLQDAQPLLQRLELGVDDLNDEAEDGCLRVCTGCCRCCACGEE